MLKRFVSRKRYTLLVSMSSIRYHACHLLEYGTTSIKLVTAAIFTTSLVPSHLYPASVQSPDVPFISEIWDSNQISAPQDHLTIVTESRVPLGRAFDKPSEYSIHLNGGY